LVEVSGSWETRTEWEKFNPVLHASDFYSGVLQIGSDD